jgi:hypothetical protein
MTENYDEIYPTAQPAPGLRRPGGQPGNQNSYKHGLYSRLNPVATAYDIPADIPPDLQQLFQSQTPGGQGDLQMYDQIALLRTCLLLLRSNLKAGLSMGVLLDYIRAINLTTATLSRLSRIQRNDLHKPPEISQEEHDLFRSVLAHYRIPRYEDEEEEEDGEAGDENEEDGDTGESPDLTSN